MYTLRAINLEAVEERSTKVRKYTGNLIKLEEGFAED